MTKLTRMIEDLTDYAEQLCTNSPGKTVKLTVTIEVPVADGAVVSHNEIGTPISKTVFVVGGDASVCAMFSAEGWINVNDPNDAELLCFTGGADVSPHLYGEENLGLSSCSLRRDKAEVGLFKAFQGKKMVGICRGGQFLNVMAGGRMIQDIKGHGMGHHFVRFQDGSKELLHEDHHQGIVPHESGDVLAVDDEDDNVEIVAYEHLGILCFQAHPEWGDLTTKKVFFDLLENI